ncbi:hypothetical protein JCM21714_1363 [Gracilibacillus boraciitolerans JCM 21714]|uniref:Hemerythrin-like domain-containing protein n=1 Tax=Gracilibacillus boraciitolerans JCM 21714 TaxID=1298598 RepID=W4VGS5_9BACI|nr:hemerythrin domain-containing protein [Gracilibacillus boraciitolerans]GAE92371.1 hypothetical protein JCM21714_1363 [Gracilibacillus boraciitolerans JCM 21714]
MKRHEALYPLSHQHHHTLAMAQQLKNADESSSVQKMTRDVIEFWEKDGEDHFRDEEEVLLPPLYAQYETVDKPEIRDMLIQHVQIRSYVQQIRGVKRPDRQLFRDLGALLQEHVRLEERVIFSMIEKAVPDNYLFQANGRFHRDSYSGF